MTFRIVVLFAFIFFFCSAAQAQAEDGWISIPVTGKTESCNKLALSCAMLAAGQPAAKAAEVYIDDHGLRRQITGADIPKLGSREETMFVYLPVIPLTDTPSNYQELVRAERLAREIPVELTTGSEVTVVPKAKTEVQYDVVMNIGDSLVIALAPGDGAGSSGIPHVSNPGRVEVWPTKAGNGRVEVVSIRGEKRIYNIQVKGAQLSVAAWFGAMAALMPLVLVLSSRRVRSKLAAAVRIPQPRLVFAEGGDADEMLLVLQKAVEQQYGGSHTFYFIRRKG